MTHKPLLGILVGGALLVGGFTAGYTSRPASIEPQSQMRCLEDEVHAWWWGSDRHDIESCLRLDDIDPKVVHFAEEVRSQRGH